MNIINWKEMSSRQIHVKEEAIEPSSLSEGQSQPRIDNIQGNARLFAKTGHWNQSQKLKYLMFIEHHYDKLKIKQNRRLWRIYKIMADFIGSRKANQCRNHHKKMETYFQGIPQIIKYYKQRIPNYQEHYQQHLQQLQSANFGIQIKRVEQEGECDIREQQLMEKPRLVRKDRSGRTSIRLEQEDLNKIPKQQELPKTDETLRSQPIIPQRKSSSHRQKRPFTFAQQNEPYYLNYIPTFPIFTSNPQETLNQGQNFFQYYQRSSQDPYELSEWIECQRLYLVWRGKVENLIREDNLA